ncbi:FAD-dependent oxidoreductase [Streptomyces nogalater]
MGEDPWWHFIRAERMSEEYRTLLGIGQTRNLVATRAEVASTRTVGRVIIEALLLWGLLGRGMDGDADIDRVLNAPTSEAWIDPWSAHLRSLGVRFVLGTEVREVLYDGGRVTGVRVSARDGSDERTVTADHYVSAMPVEHARRTWGAALRAADPQLARCDALQTDWMTGVQFYLRTPTPVVHGHVNCLDSPWSVTGIGQAQFWDVRDFSADYGDGRAHDCLSAIVSEWHKPGILYGKTARECTREEIVEECWAQLKDALNDSGKTTLRDADRIAWFVDPAVTGLGGPDPQNREPLLIHPAGTLYNRPSAKTAVPNFFLAGDYVRTDVDLATMEGANESARRAVNALLDRDGSDAERCRIWELYRPRELEPSSASTRCATASACPTPSTWDDQRRRDPVRRQRLDPRPPGVSRRPFCAMTCGLGCCTALSATGPVAPTAEADGDAREIVDLLGAGGRRGIRPEPSPV